jgi:gp16 family phage-associated protein
MKRSPNVKTAEQVRAEFNYTGKSLAEWGREHGFTRFMVSQVLSGRRKCLRGQSHQIAVLLGLKAGEIQARRTA